MQTISTIEFDKKVEQEAAFLTYQEGMSKDKAQKLARQTISEKYQVAWNSIAQVILHFKGSIYHCEKMNSKDFPKEWAFYLHDDVRCLII